MTNKYQNVNFLGHFREESVVLQEGAFVVIKQMPLAIHLVAPVDA
jgi:hypothetical protein